MGPQPQKIHLLLPSKFHLKDPDGHVTQDENPQSDQETVPRDWDRKTDAPCIGNKSPQRARQQET